MLVPVPLAGDAAAAVAAGRSAAVLPSFAGTAARVLPDLTAHTATASAAAAAAEAAATRLLRQEIND